MAAPCLETDRLRLDRFTVRDIAAFFDMCADERVTRFLPFDALASPEEAARLLDQKFLARYRKVDAGERCTDGLPFDACWAVRLKGAGEFAGFIQIGADVAHDVGYALKRDAWGQGFAREALAVVIAWARVAGYPFLTATHDVDNPRSDAVMRACGLTYRYTYREDWLPKKPTVDFRLYQIDLVPGVATYDGYWRAHPEHVVEDVDGAQPQRSPECN